MAVVLGNSLVFLFVSHYTVYCTLAITQCWPALSGANPGNKDIQQASGLSQSYCTFDKGRGLTLSRTPTSLTGQNMAIDKIPSNLVHCAAFHMLFSYGLYRSCVATLGHHSKKRPNVEKQKR